MCNFLSFLVNLKTELTEAKTVDLSGCTGLNIENVHAPKAKIIW